MFDRKILYVFLAVTLIAILVVLLSSNMEFEFHATGNVDLEAMSDVFRDPVTKALSTYLSFLVFLAVLATAGLIPNMLIKGRTDFYLSKPISRSSLLLNKFLAIWVVYGATLTVCGIITYGATVLVHDLFDWRVMYLFGLNLVSFFIWLSVTITAGIISGSNAISIMTAFLVWVAQSILWFHEQIKEFLGSKLVGYIVDALYYILPKTAEIDALTDSLAMGRPVESWMPLYSSLIFSFALLHLAIAAFKRKDY
jgi:ABC-type transport system involved in multi-copper enzyme maturation permease subunit